MSFSANQIRKLQRDVKACDIRTREVNGRELSYIEGWHAISEANRIFGFDGWNRETIETRCVVSRDNRGTHHVVYVAKVRVTVRAESETVVREGFGTGEAQGGTAGEAHEKAIKTAETDATKRAFATFGKPFGLALYISTKRPKATKETPDIERRRPLQKVGANGRYYVPSWKPAQLDPELNAVTQVQTLTSATLPAQVVANQPQNDNSPVPAMHSFRSVQADLTVSHNTSIAPSLNHAPIGPSRDVQSTSVSQADYPLLIDRPRRKRDAEHLRFVASQPCLICSRTPSDAHHLKFAQPKAMSRKVSDEFTVPLCRTHHRQLHHGGDEVSWWNDMDVDPLPIAQDLWVQSHNAEPATQQSLRKGTGDDE
jgi:hypothetical protein